MELLGRLRRAVKKLTFLLNLQKFLTLTESTLRMAALIRSRAPAVITAGHPRWGRRAISFSDRPGLRACVEDHDNQSRRGFARENGDEEEDGNNNSTRSECSSRWTSPCDTTNTLRRTTSYPLEVDVDRHAEMFIENFYKHLVYEKQVSLNLRYCRDDSSSFDYSADSSVSPLSSADSQLVSPT